MTTFTTVELSKPVVSANGDLEVAERLPAGIERVNKNVTRTVETEGLVHADDSTHSSVYWMYARMQKPSYATCFSFSVTYDYSRIEHSIDRHLAYYTDSTYHLISVPTSVGMQGAGEWLFKNWGRFTDNNPWLQHAWFRNNVLRWIEHFPAPSEKVLGLLSYYQSTDKRARDIRTPMKAGKYLQKFFSDILSQEEIQTYAMEWSSAFAPLEMKLATTPEEIVAVYQNNYNGSCMHFGGNDYDGPVHPAHVYGAGDLAQAYIGDVNEEEGVKGRCLVWPDKKLYYAKWYGDYHRMEAALLAAGYSEGYKDDFTGARLLKIKSGNGFVVPYVDTHISARVEGDYLIIGSGSVHLRNTNGLSYEGQQCDYDGEVYNDDEFTYVENYGNVYDGNLNEGPFFECVINQAWYHNDDMAASHDDYPISQSAVSYLESRVFYCSATEMYYPTSDFEGIELGNGETWEEGYADDNALVCAFDGQMYPKDEVTTLADGTLACVDMDNQAFRIWLHEGNHVEYYNWINSSPDQLDLLVAA